MSLPNVNEFRNRLALGGARGNYYLVYGPTIGTDMAYLARSAALPAASVNVVPVFTPGGRQLKYAGERTFEQWTVGVYNDTQMVTRRKFEVWQTRCANWGDPIGADALGAYAASDWIVTQLSRSGVPTRSYRFYNMWPSALSAIELSFDEKSEIEQFDVTFDFSHFEPVGGNQQIDNIISGVTEGIRGALGLGSAANAIATSATFLSELQGQQISSGNADSDAFDGSDASS